MEKNGTFASPATAFGKHCFYRYLEGLQGERLSAWRLPRLCISLGYEGNLQSLQGFPLASSSPATSEKRIPSLD